MHLSFWNWEGWPALVAIGTLTLALVAAFSETIKKYINRTNLEFLFSQKEPDCLFIPFSLSGQNVGYAVKKVMSYYIRFQVKNTGRNNADNVEVFLSDIYELSNGRVQPMQRHIPLHLKWSNSMPGENQYARINRGFPRSCDMGFILDPRQARIRPERDPQPLHQELPRYPYETPELVEKQEREVVLALDTIVKPNSGSHLLPKGSYILRLQIAAENSKKYYCYFRINLTDQDPEDDQREKVWGYFITIKKLTTKEAKNILRDA